MRKDFYINELDINKIKKKLLNKYIRKMPDDIDISLEEDYKIWQYYYTINAVIYEMINEDVLSLNYMIDMILHIHNMCVKMSDIMGEKRYNDYMNELDVRIGLYFSIAFHNEMYETMENIKKFNDLYLNVEDFNVEWLEGERKM